MQVLHIDSSILGDASASRILTAAIVDTLRSENPGATVVRRDLAVEAIPPLGGATAAGAAARRPPAYRLHHRCPGRGVCPTRRNCTPRLALRPPAESARM